jgi:hypothetical protein
VVQRFELRPNAFSMALIENLLLDLRVHVTYKLYN